MVALTSFHHLIVPLEASFLPFQSLKIGENFVSFVVSLIFAEICVKMRKSRVKLYCALSVAALFVASCTDKIEPSSVDGQMTANAKIANPSESKNAENILIKVNDGTSESIMDELAPMGAQSVERLFPSMPGKEDLEAQFGMDKWYVVTLPEGVPLEGFAEDAAALSSIQTVEYSVKYEHIVNPEVYEAEPVVPDLTRADNGMIFNDPYLPQQWGYINNGDAGIVEDAYAGGDINVKDVWNTLTCGDPDIIVAVVDEGVDYSHPDLAANMWVNEKEKNGKAGVDDDGNGYVDDIYGYNFVAGEGEIKCTLPGDTGHGTHCAGVIAAVNNNRLGVSGVAGGTGHGDGCRIMSCMNFSGGMGGTTLTASRAIKYAADMGASIISCSFGVKGGTFKSDGTYIRSNKAEVDALRYFEATKNNPVLDGNIAIFASGNDGMNYATYPGALNDIISVSAYGPDYLPAYYSNYGPGCNIVAPGGEYYHKPYNANSRRGMILSTYPRGMDSEDAVESGYAYMQGTSMACPHVSGIAALGLSYAKKLGKTFTTKEFKELLLSSAKEFDSRLNGEKKLYNKTLNLGEYRHKMGTGGIDTYVFMMQIEGIPCLTAEVGKNQWLDVSQYFGTSSVSLTYLGDPGKEEGQTLCEISDADRESLGLVEEPYMQFGRLYVHPTKLGSGKVKIKAVAGGTVVGGQNVTGGMFMEQEVSIITRTFKSKNGGWL